MIAQIDYTQRECIMPTKHGNIIIGSRESQLALWQAELASRLLSQKHGDKFTFEIKGMITLGDNVQNIALSQFSDKGIFTKELDAALINKILIVLFIVSKICQQHYQKG